MLLRTSEGKDCGPRGRGHKPVHEQGKRGKRHHTLLKFTFGLLEKTQNSQTEEVDWDVLEAGLLIDLVEVF